jgi:hypothetical protein
MDHDARKLQAKRALDVTSMSVSGSGRVGQWDGFEENKTHQYTITAHHLRQVGGRYAHSDMDINRDATAAAHTMIWTSTMTGENAKYERVSSLGADHLTCAGLFPGKQGHPKTCHLVFWRCGTFFLLCVRQ